MARDSLLRPRSWSRANLPPGGRLIELFANAPVLLCESYYLVYRKKTPREQPGLQVLRSALRIDTGRLRLR